MSTTIDERVVSMQFDNKQFESNVKTSMSTLDKLKQSLNLTGASKGLENVSSAAKSCNLSPLSNAAEAVKVKFSALEVMAVTALSNITNSAVNAGKRLVSSLSIDQITAGWSKYGQKTTSVQSIINATGKSINEVNGYLDKLMWFSDETSYGFTDMTAALGQLTSAGGNIDKLVPMIEGIANATAFAGKGVNEFSRSIYNLNQSYSAGYLQYMDWKSLELAGVASKQLKETFIQTAEELGKIQKGQVTIANFGETLKDKWADTTVMEAAFGKFAEMTEKAYEMVQAGEVDTASEAYEILAKQYDGISITAAKAAQEAKTFSEAIDATKDAVSSGWMKSFEIIFGNYEQAKVLWTDLANTLWDVFASGADSRNELLSGALESNYDRFIGKLDESGISTEELKKSLSEVYKDHGYDLSLLIDEYGSFDKALKSGAVSSDLLNKSLKNLSAKKVDTSLIKTGLGLQSTGDDVKQLEKLLASLGYELKGKDGKDYSDDGYFGTLTRDALKQFQKDKGLKVTGIVDEATLAALEEANKKTAELDESIFKLADDLGKLGGRELLIESLKNVFNGLMSVIKPIKEAFREIFPPITAEQLYNAIEKFHALTEKLKLSSEQSAKLKSAFKGLFSVIDIGWTFLKELAGGIVKLIGNLSGLGNGVLNVAGSFGDWISGLRDSIKESDVFGVVIDKVVGFLQKVIDKVKAVSSFLKEKIATPGWEGFLSVLKGIWGFIQKVGSKIAEVGRNIGKALSSAFSNGDMANGLDLLNGGLLAGALLGIKKFFGNLSKILDKGLGKVGLIDQIKSVLDTVSDSLEAWQQNLKSGTLLKIAAAIGILAASILVIASIEPGKIAASLGAITVLFADLIGSLKLFSMFSGDLKGVTKAAAAMIGISLAVLILSAALKTISDISWEGIAKGLIGIVGLTGVVVLAAKAMSTQTKAVIKGATQMVIFAAALKILASVCKDLSELSWEGLAKGLAGVGVLMAEVSIFLRTAKFSGKSITTATGIVILSAAIKVLASACKDFSAMNWEEIGKGLAAIGGLLAELAIFTNLTGNAKHIISTGLSLVLISAAMKIFASAVSDFAGMSWDEIGRGLAAIAGALAAVAISAKIMPKNMIGIGTGLVIASAALIILADALGKMSGMSWEGIGKGLTALGGSIVILAIGLNIMNGTLGGSAALIIAAGALAILTPVLTTLGAMSWESIGKGLITIAGAFAVIGIAGLLLGPIVPAILGIAGALALVGIASLTFGAGVMAIAAGFGMLATMTSAGATAVVAALTIIVTGIASLIPTVIRELGNGIIEFCKVIGESATEIAKAINAVILALLDVLVTSIPAIADGALKLITGVLAALVEYTPQIVDSIMQFLISALQTVADRTPELVSAVMDVITSLFAAVTDAIIGLDGNTLAKAAIGVALMAALMALFGAIAPLIPGALVGVLGMGVMIAELALVIAAIGALAQIPGLQWLVGEGATLLASIGSAIGGFVGSIIGGIAEGITSSLPQIGTDLSTFMINLGPFIEGAKGIDASVTDGVSAIVGVITSITAASLLESITSWLTGSSSMETFGTQLVAFGKSLKDFSDSIVGIDTTAISSAAIASSMLADMANAIPNTGGLWSVFAGDNDMATFGTQLVTFGESLKNFASSVSGVDTEAITAAATASGSLTTMADAIPRTGGLWSVFAGDNDMATFGTQLVSFGESLKSFASSVTGIDTEAITAASTAAGSLTTMADAIPRTGGLWSVFAGDNDMTIFGAQLVSFGGSLKSFANSVTGIDTEAVSAAATASASLSEMAKAIPNTGGLWAVFAGDNDMATFGSQLVSFGGSLKSFSNEVSGIDTASVTAATDAATALSTMANTIPNSGGLFSWFSGDNSMDTFGDQIKGFGSGLKGFADNVAGISAISVSIAISIATSMNALANSMTNGGNMGKLKGYGDNIKDFGWRLKDFYNYISEIDASNLSSITNSLTSLSSISGDASGLSSFINSLGKVGTDGVNKFLSAFDKSAGRASQAGAKLITNLVKGVTGKTSMLTKAFTSTVSKTIASIKSKYSDFNSAGRYLVQGFANGISSNTYLATAKAKAMAEAAKIAARKALGIKSPSKEFYKIGAFSGAGFINALSDYQSKVYKAGGNIAEAARNGLSNAISKVSSLIENGIDGQPTIRPVLDLSDIANGASAINGMLDMSPSVGVMSNIGAISSMMNMNQNGANNDDVISAIHDLGRQLGNTSGDTYNFAGVTYDDGSNIANAVKTLVRAAKVERRI